MKQTFCILIILISSLTTYGQTEFYIHLNSDVNVDSVSVAGINLSKTLKSGLQNGIAKFEIPSKSSDQYFIYVADKRIDGWFNAGKVDIYLDFKDNELSVLKTKNTPVYEMQARYFRNYEAFLKDKSNGAEFIKRAIIENDQDAFVLVPLNHYLKLNQNDIVQLNFVESFLNKQPLSTKQHAIYSLISSRIEKLKSTNSINLDKYSLISTKGNKSLVEINSGMEFTVLGFWFTSCSPCIKEHNEILSDPKMFANLNAELIGISTDSDQEKWIKYLEKKNINWRNYRIGETSLDKDLGVWSFPTYLILDKEENIVGSYSNIEDTIKALKK
ncbi:MAG: TlpA disulfide reductase family protein [Fulvivirga sp.]|uniref:TlpA family protein disulfide reductase n=1 Tax=Fulvivirga sp. TaxID=1931237 RepID=UPI0032F277CD